MNKNLKITEVESKNSKLTVTDKEIRLKLYKELPKEDKNKLINIAKSIDYDKIIEINPKKLTLRGTFYISNSKWKIRLRNIGRYISFRLKET
jgi:ribosomal protein L24